MVISSQGRKYNHFIQQTRVTGVFRGSSTLVTTAKLSGRLHGGQLIKVVHGGFAAVNRGADFVKYMVPSLRARTRYLTRHRAQCSQAVLARTAHGAGQHRDYIVKVHWEVK